MITAPSQHGGYFIAVEGGDGAGKGGVIESLSEALRKAGYHVITTREPGGTPEGEKLRSILVAADGPEWDPNAELLLMTAARLQHVKRVIKPALANGSIVISDRFVASTVAYQGAGRGLSISAILKLHRNFVDDIWPDTTLVLDVDSRIGLDRSRSKLAKTGQNEGRFEELDDLFHQRVRQSFLQQAENRPSRYIVVDSERPAEQVRRQAVDRVMEVLHCRKLGRL